ncbi:NAD(+) synthase [bacterium]|nr:NAD(+) synthase [bacterium]
MPAFNNLYGHGFIRAAACSPRVTVADPLANAAETLKLFRRAHEERCAVLVCPELGLSGYALDDLHMQGPLLADVRTAIADIVEASRDLFPVIAVGAPLLVGSSVHGCAVVIHRGRVLGVVPKTYLPNYREFYEKRQFASSFDAVADEIDIAGQTAPFGVDLLFRATDIPGFVLGVEICEDVWAAIPPSTHLALGGATVIVNLSASNITIGKAEERDLLCSAQSARCNCAYLYSAAGVGESTTDLAWDGHLAVFELGATLAESPRFSEDSVLLSADIDVERIVQDRIRLPTFRDCAATLRPELSALRRVAFDLAPDLDSDLPLVRAVSRFPYVPDDPARLDQDCYEAYNIQVRGLRQRLEAARIEKAVIGISGGLDSTQALLVACRAFDLMGRPRSDVIGVTMPGFATTDGTKSNAWKLMEALGVDAREVDIRPLASQMLADLDHPYARGEKVYDVTFENVQAGLRTDYLFRLANHVNGAVIGTGDLSELALGWCTYGVGDHMSHYNVNASVSKTLIQHLIRWCAGNGQYSAAVGRTLRAILATEISPELVPADESGAIQSTQAKIGPYNLHDFTLYYTTRFGFSPTKIAFLAHHAWSDAATGAWPANIEPDDKVAYSLEEITRWLEVFAFRFFAISQFKRSCVPNGPKISSGGSLSPRGDWRAPSDSSPEPWLRDIRRLKAQLAAAKG